MISFVCCFFFFSSRRRHTRFDCDWSSDVCSSDLGAVTFRSALSIGSAKLAEEENEIEKLAEEIQRAVDIYESERVGQGITKLVVTGAEIDLARLIPSLTAELRLPVQRVSLVERQTKFCR